MKKRAKSPVMRRKKRDAVRSSFRSFGGRKTSVSG
jgi:hypothetical protein